MVPRRAGEPDAPERDFYYFDDALPHGYASWSGIRSLPKLELAERRAAERFADVLRRCLDLGLDGWRIDVANMAGRYRDDRCQLATSRAGCASRSGRAARRRARARLPRRPAGGGWHGTMNYAGFLRPVWAWLLRGDLPGAAAAVLGHSGRAAEPRRRGGGRRDARLPRRRAVALGAALVDAARQPRHGALPHGRRLARPAARRHRPADDDARRADGLRRRRARARGRLGRGCAADDAVELRGDVGHGASSRSTAR